MEEAVNRQTYLLCIGRKELGQIAIIDYETINKHTIKTNEIFTPKTI